VIGYTDLPSRLPAQSSTLYSNNISKFLLSMGPFTTGKKDEFVIDYDDEAVRGALVLDDGALKWPAPPPPAPAQVSSVHMCTCICVSVAVSGSGSASSEMHRRPEGNLRLCPCFASSLPTVGHILTSPVALPCCPAQAAAPAAAKAAAAAPTGPKDLYDDTLRNALTTTGAAAATLAIGAVSPGSAFSSMLTKFGLASICGYQTVWGVTPALHSPLMSVTNAISGLTAVGGIVLAGGGVIPGNTAQVGRSVGVCW
jgi:hypothetical protein